jgi:hypothetical protein
MTEPAPISAMPDRHPAENVAVASCPASADPAEAALPGHGPCLPSCDEALDRVRRLNPGWVIVANPDGTFTVRRDFLGNQQLITVPTLGELHARLQALPP